MFGLQPILGLAAALLVSLAVNVWQWGKIASAKAAREGEIAAAVAEGKAQAAQESAGRASLVAALAQADNAALVADLSAIAERAQQTRTVYRDRIRELPAPTCAPGAERMTAANRLIGGEPVP